MGQVRDLAARRDRDRPARRAARRRRSAGSAGRCARSRAASNPTSAGSASTLIRATRPTLPAARDLVVGRETSGCVDPLSTASGGRHETAGHVDDHERPVVGGTVAGVRGRSVTAGPRVSAPTSTFCPGGAVDPPAPHGRTGQHGRVDGDRRGSGVPDDQERAGRAGDVDDDVDGLRPTGSPRGSAAGRTARPSSAARMLPLARRTCICVLLSAQQPRSNGPVLGSTRHRS